MLLLSLLSYIFIQTFGLIIAFTAAAVLLYIIVRRFHSRLVTALLVIMYVGVSVFFYVPNGIPHGFDYPSSLTTYGPSTGPGLPFANVISFFRHFNDFEKVADIARDPNDIPAPITRTEPTEVHIDITAKEVISEIAPGVYFNYWTYDRKVPGPFLRVMEGDTVTVTFHNDKSSLHNHTIDFHAVIGPGGGAAVLMANPGETKTLTFKAMFAGVYVYHCAEANVAVHMAHGQYGLILVEPKGGLPPVDRELYVMQGELYTTGSLGKKGLQIFDSGAMLDGKAQYIVFNGRTGALTSPSTNTMKANVGEKVRVYFGNGGVNLVSSFHVIGEIFEHVYHEGAITSEPHTNVQTTTVPAGGATVVDFTLMVPGKYVFVDHALARLDRGAWGVLFVEGPHNPAVFNGVAQDMAGH